MNSPSWRKPAGMFFILLLITMWAVLIASFDWIIAPLPVLVQMIVYCFTGIIWIAPLKPLLRWMETGRWRD